MRHRKQRPTAVMEVCRISCQLQDIVTVRKQVAYIGLNQEWDINGKYAVRSHKNIKALMYPLYLKT